MMFGNRCLDRDAEQKTLGKRKRAKRASKPKAPPPPKPLPPAIDVAALVDEIKSGRYPSFENYEGEHGDTCVLCKNGGMMYCCEFCGNAEHFECVLARLDALQRHRGLG